MLLKNTDIINGLLSLLTVIVCIFVGLKIMLKFNATKERRFLLIGASWIGMSEPWWPSTLGFILALFDIHITAELYFYLHMGFLPFFLLAWLISMQKPLMLSWWNYVIYAHLIISALLQVLLITFLFVNIDLIGVLLTPVDIDFNIISIISIIYYLSIFITTGFIFSIKTMKMDDSELTLRGRFLLIAFILFLIGAILETVITITINRVIVFISAIVFYIGYIFPTRIKEIFLK